MTPQPAQSGSEQSYLDRIHSRLRSWRARADKAERERDRYRETLEGLEQLFSDQIRARGKAADDEAYRLVHRALRNSAPDQKERQP